MAILKLDPQSLAPEIRYKLLIGTVVPRPIAVVSSQSPAGALNIAPFSFFNVVSHNPMTLAFSISGLKITGEEKDTLRNVRPCDQGGLGEFVVNIATLNFAHEMAKTASALPYGESEFEFAGLTPVDSACIVPPRIGEARVSYECKTVQIIVVGQSHLVLGEVVCIHIDDAVLSEKYRIDPTSLEAIGRMAGSQYCHTTALFELSDDRSAPQKTSRPE